MCAECEFGYVGNSDFHCNKCPERNKNLIRLTFIFVAVIIAFVWFIRYNFIVKLKEGFYPRKLDIMSCNIGLDKEGNIKLIDYLRFILGSKQ